MSNQKNIELTKSYITEALFRLMEERPYEEIAISDITKRAGVGRATFYRHFKTKDDIVREYFVTETKVFIQSVAQVPSRSDDFYENIFTAFSQLKKEKRAFKCLLAAHMESFYLDHMNREMAIYCEQNHQSNFHYVPYHIAGSLCNISLEWIRRDCKESVKTMADAYFRLLFPSLPTQSG
ncbi:MAG: TetR/AcrR family transcriptional regulator [Eubacterium sp.]|nr:TetR/AcrR family transcriptional regulator [Eubacterium sp.]